MRKTYPPCAEFVYHGLWSRRSPCKRKGKIERNGQHWCKQHDPEEKLVKDKARKKLQIKKLNEYHLRNNSHVMMALLTELLDTGCLDSRSSDTDPASSIKSRAQRFVKDFRK